MPQNEDVPMDNSAAMEAIGGSAGAILAGSTLERALMGLVLGMAVGLAADAIWKILRGRPAPRSAAPRTHPI